jgi:putative transposase
MIVKNHAVIVIEDLKIANMTASAKGSIESPGRNVRQKAGRNRSLLDVSPGQIRLMLGYKAGWYGSRVIVVDPAYTSQQCSGCGKVDGASRISQSQFVCTNCGSIFDADVNAAKNVWLLANISNKVRQHLRSVTSFDNAWVRSKPRGPSGQARLLS